MSLQATTSLKASYELQAFDNAAKATSRRNSFYLSASGGQVGKIGNWQGRFKSDRSHLHTLNKFLSTLKQTNAALGALVESGKLTGGPLRKLEAGTVHAICSADRLCKEATGKILNDLEDILKNCLPAGMSPPKGEALDLLKKSLERDLNQTNQTIAQHALMATLNALQSEKATTNQIPYDRGWEYNVKQQLERIFASEIRQTVTQFAQGKINDTALKTLPAFSEALTGLRTYMTSMNDQKLLKPGQTQDEFLGSLQGMYGSGHISRILSDDEKGMLMARLEQRFQDRWENQKETGQVNPQELRQSVQQDFLKNELMSFLRDLPAPEIKQEKKSETAQGTVPEDAQKTVQEGAMKDEMPEEQIRKAISTRLKNSSMSFSSAANNQATPDNDQATPINDQAIPVNDQATPVNNKDIPVNDQAIQEVNFLVQLRLRELPDNDRTPKKAEEILLKTVDELVSFMKNVKEVDNGKAEKDQRWNTDQDRLEMQKFAAMSLLSMWQYGML